MVSAIVLGITALILFDPPLPGEVYPDLGNQHMATLADPHVAYNSDPPSSGPHLGAQVPAGVSEDPVPKEAFIHTLEDGGIVLAYDCPDGCDDLVAEMQILLEESGGRVLLTPYTGIVTRDGTPHRAAAVAWTRVYYFDELDEDTRAGVTEFMGLWLGVDHHVR